VNKINVIEAEGDSIIWVGTEGGGLVKFDGSNWLIYNTNNSDISSNNITTIKIDENGVKWIGTSSGLTKINGSDWYTFDTSNSGLPENKINALTIDSNGTKWIGTYNGLTAYNEKGIPSTFKKEITICNNELPYIWHEMTFNNLGGGLTLSTVASTIQAKIDIVVGPGRVISEVDEFGRVRLTSELYGSGSKILIEDAGSSSLLSNMNGVIDPIDGLDEHGCLGQTLDLGGLHLFLVHPHLELVVGHSLCLGLEKKKVFFFLIFHTCYIILHSIIESHNVRIIENATDDRLEARYTDGLSHIGYVKPYIFPQPQSTPPLFAGRRYKYTCDLVIPLFYGEENKLLSFSIRLNIDKLPVHFVGFRGKIPVHLIQNLIPVNGIGRGGKEQTNN